jgi:drug/metabolite transporter (DMT)-like permease
VVAFTAYLWLLRAVSPTLVSTYSYVNPLVAVFLGWAIAGEPVTGRTLIAAVIIVASVAMITLARSKESAPPKRLSAESAPENNPAVAAAELAARPAVCVQD